MITSVRNIISEKAAIFTIYYCIPAILEKLNELCRYSVRSYRVVGVPRTSDYSSIQQEKLGLVQYKLLMNKNINSMVTDGDYPSNSTDRGLGMIPSWDSQHVSIMMVAFKCND